MRPRPRKRTAEEETEAERDIGIRLVGLTPKPVFRHWC